MLIDPTPSKQAGGLYSFTTNISSIDKPCSFVKKRLTHSNTYAETSSQRFVNLPYFGVSLKIHQNSPHCFYHSPLINSA